MGRKKLDRACLCVKARLRRGWGGGDSGNLWQRRPGWLDRGMGEVALEVIYSILHARDLFAKGRTSHSFEIKICALHAI